MTRSLNACTVRAVLATRLRSALLPGPLLPGPLLPGLLLSLGALFGTAWGATLEAQGVRGTLLTTGRYVELRPIRQDTVAESLVTPAPGGGFEFEGRPVTCIGGGVCIYYRSLDPEGAVILTQDVSATAWGFGVQGLSATTLVRARFDAGGEFLWPRSDDAFDAILAYVEWDRDPLLLRVGRQRTMSGLGFSGYDGVNVRVDPRPGVRAEAYAGRSLARGLEEPRHEALRGIEPGGAILRDRNAYLLGAFVEAEPLSATVVGARYQREIWSDRSALVSERASVDLRSALLLPVRLEASLDYDFAFARIGKARVTARLPLEGPGLVLETSVRRYVPYFELWTIWGFFDPVGYHELQAQASWVALPGLQLRGSAGWRRYEDTGGGVFIRPLERQGQRYSIGASGGLPGGWTADGTYRMERGFGSFLSSGDVSAGWTAGRRFGITVHGTAFQRIEEFRLGEGVVLGAGVGLHGEVLPGVELTAGASLYRQSFENRPGSLDWNQRRGWLSTRIRFGEDPGGRPTVGGAGQVRPAPDGGDL